jgi:hypothetical protein
MEQSRSLTSVTWRTTAGHVGFYGVPTLVLGEDVINRCGLFGQLLITIGAPPGPGIEDVLPKFATRKLRGKNNKVS